MVVRLGDGEGGGAVGDILEHEERPLVVGGDCTNLCGVLDTLRGNVGRAGLAFTAATSAGS
jgi:hypothetical protein